VLVAVFQSLKKRRSSSACVEMYEERTVTTLCISQQVSMPRNRALGSCWRLLGILALVWAQRAQGGGSCKCKQGQYCADTGYDFESKSDKSPDCKICKSGYYWNQLPHDEVAGPDIPQWTMASRSRTVMKQVRDPCYETFSYSSSICGLIKIPAPPLPGLKRQVCQHCPIHTIPNSQYIANKGARCFYSCEMHTEK
jgi:hypothetical protein